MRAWARWTAGFAVLAAIVLVYHRWFHVNPTTVALTLLLFILSVAARWTLRHAIVMSVAATLAYNYWFLPPEGGFTINDPQNWLALLAFLATSVIGSRLSQRARGEAEEAQSRERELRALFTLSRDLLQTEKVGELVGALPPIVRGAAGARSLLLYLLDGERVFYAGEPPRAAFGLPELRGLALRLNAPELGPGGEARIPLRAGVRPRGLLVLEGARLSTESLETVGGLVSIAFDRAQALEDAARSEAAKKSEQLRTLVLDSITHELRTPLTSIKGAASALLFAPAMGQPSRRELLSIIDEESDRLNRLVSQAVEMARLEAHEVRMNFAPVPVEDLPAHAEEAIAAARATHTLRVDLPHLPQLPAVLADAEMIGKVLSNLLENASKYSPAGSTITVTARERDGAVLVSVADRGIGIDAAEQSLVFDRLFRSRTQDGVTPGTGMGLAISRAIVESHRGALSVESRLGEGSTFTFSLPVADDEKGPLTSSS